MKRFALFLLLSLLFTVSSSCAALSLPARPAVDGTDGYYQAEAMASYVRPSETAEVATKFLESREDRKLDWTNRGTFEEIVKWVNETLDFTYQSDPKVDGRADLWRTPANTLANKGGDCEDFSIFMASLLRQLGCAHDMRIILARMSSGTLHLYLSIEMPDWEPLIIDSYPYSTSSWTRAIVIRVGRID